MLKLYEIANQYQSLLTLDDPDLPAEAIADTPEGLTGDLQEKALNVAAWFENLQIEADAMREAEKRMATRRKALEAKIESGREYLKRNMEACGITEIKSPEMRLRIKTNPPSVCVDDAGAVPALFLRTKTVEELDRVMIKEWFAQGLTVPVCRLESKTRLEIK